MEPPDDVNMEVFEALLLTQFTAQSICTKLVAELNMPAMWVTWETSHFDRSWLNAVAWLNAAREEEEEKEREKKKEEEKKKLKKVKILYEYK